MIEALAIFITAVTGVYFIVLGIAAVLTPGRVQRFLRAFASTRAYHLSEMTIRLVVGAAMIIAAPRLQHAAVFEVFGWILVVTSAVLVMLPWRWHQRFAERVVPPFTHYILAIGLCCLALGAFILMALVRGNAA